MPNITKDLARNIAPKLRGVFDVTESSGADHDLVTVCFQGMRVGRFGIQRGSKKDANHNYIASQLHLSRMDAYNLARCPLSAAEFLALLREDGHVPKPPSEPGEEK